jgi:hypothetical protein
MKIKILHIILLLVIANVAFTQNAVKDLRGVREFFLNAKEIGFEVEVYHFKTESSKGSLLSKGMMRKLGKNYYSSFMGDKMIVNPQKGTVIVDEPNKEITYFDIQKKISKPQQISLPDSVFSQFSFVSENKNIKIYENKSTDLEASIIKTVLHINDKNQLKKIIYFYNKDTDKKSYDAYKVEISYKNIITSDIKKSYFNISEYVSIKNKKPQLTKRYASFRLLN